MPGEFRLLTVKPKQQLDKRMLIGSAQAVVMDATRTGLCRMISDNHFSTSNILDKEIKS